MYIDIFFIITLIVCFIILLINISEKYNTEIEIDIKTDENVNSILNDEEKERQRKDLEEKKRLYRNDYNKLQQLRLVQEASRREADYGVPNAYGFAPSFGANPAEEGREYTYEQEQINP